MSKQLILSYLARRRKELFDQFPGCAVHIVSESKADPGALFGRDDWYGTCDLCIRVFVDGDHLTGRCVFVELIDYKDGMNPTDAREQLEQYAVGVIASMDRRPLTIHMTVIQPKLRMKGMAPITTAAITLGELMQVASTMKDQAAATDAPDAPLVPGEKQCKYCAHKGACSALSTKVLGDSGISFKGIDVATQAADKEPTSMTDQQLREIIEAAPLVRQMIEAAEAEALRRLEQGAVIEGLKAVRGRGSRGWAVTDEQEMADKLKKFGLPKDVIWETKLISVAKAEKAVWTKRDGTQVQLTDRQLKTLKSEYTKTSEGKLTIAPSSDPRPAVTLSAAALFQPVEQAVTPELPSFLL